MFKIGDVEFNVAQMTEEAHVPYMARLTAIAQTNDRPLERFCAALGGLSPSDRAAAIHGFLQRDDWQKPPAGLINQAATTYEGVAALVAAVMTPKPTQAQFNAMCEGSPANLYRRICLELVPPSDDEFLARNKLIKDRIKSCLHNRSQAGKPQSEELPTQETAATSPSSLPTQQEAAVAQEPETPKST